MPIVAHCAPLLMIDPNKTKLFSMIRVLVDFDMSECYLHPGTTWIPGREKESFSRMFGPIQRSYDRESFRNGHGSSLRGIW